MMPLNTTKTRFGTYVKCEFWVLVGPKREIESSLYGKTDKMESMILLRRGFR